LKEWRFSNVRDLDAAARLIASGAPTHHISVISAADHP
jgi:hypothetical protein